MEGLAARLGDLLDEERQPTIDYSPTEIGLAPPTGPEVKAYWRGEIGYSQDRVDFFLYEDPRGRREVMVGEWRKVQDLMKWVDEVEDEISILLSNRTYDLIGVKGHSSADGYVDHVFEREFTGESWQNERFHMKFQHHPTKKGVINAVAWVEDLIEWKSPSQIREDFARKIKDQAKARAEAPKENDPPIRLQLHIRYRHIFFNRIGFLRDYDERAVKLPDGEFTMQWEDENGRFAGDFGRATRESWARVLQPVEEN